MKQVAATGLTLMAIVAVALAMVAIRAGDLVVSGLVLLANLALLAYIWYAWRRLREVRSHPVMPGFAGEYGRCPHVWSDIRRRESGGRLMALPFRECVLGCGMKLYGAAIFSSKLRTPRKLR